MNHRILIEMDGLAVIIAAFWAAFFSSARGAKR